MLETITAVNQAVNSFIWGIPAMVCIIGVGLLLSVRTGFLQLPTVNAGFVRESAEVYQQRNKLRKGSQ